MARASEPIEQREAKGKGRPPGAKSEPTSNIGSGNAIERSSLQPVESSDPSGARPGCAADSDSGMSAQSRLDTVSSVGPEGQSGTEQIAGSTEDRQERIAREAYYRAERRGFEPGRELEDWLEAERELESRRSSSDMH